MSIVSRRSNPNPNNRQNGVSDDTHKLMTDIKEKLDKSPALNGEFDTLIHKVDKIEQSNGHLSKKVDKIYDAIYHHDDGIIAKMKENKQENQRAHDKTEGDLANLKEWKETKDKTDEKIEAKLDKIESINETVKDLVGTRNTTWNVMKWFLAAAGGGIITVVSRYILFLLTR